jgi:LL-diaminopimelate aminotransferase
MIGWRMGWVCGNERIVRAFADVKDNCDSGQFIAIQKAAAAALNHPEIADATRAKYRRRLEKLVALLQAVGFEAKMPGGSYFLYTRAPRGVAGGPSFDTAAAAAEYLITRHSIVTVPWDDAGAYLRFSVTYESADEAAEDELMRQTRERLAPLPWQFA